MIKLFNCYNSAGYFDTNLLVKEIPKTENEKKVNKPITSRKQKQKPWTDKVAADSIYNIV